jgi:hypothetical protein
VGNIPGINHLLAIRAFERAGFWILRKGKHVILTNGSRVLVIPRHNPINGFTMGGIVRDAGMAPEEFREFL